MQSDRSDRDDQLREMLRASHEMTELAHRRAKEAVDKARQMRNSAANPRLVELEQALTISNDAIRQQQRTLAIVSHELRQAISAIAAAREVARAKEDGTAKQRAETVIDRQLGLIRRLLDDLADASRLAFDVAQVTRQKVAVQEIVQSAVDSTKAVMETRRQELRLSMAAGPAWVDADPLRLQQVFSNLLTNAAKYTPPQGRVTVQVSKSAGEVRISVADTGRGIAPDMLSTIFEPFKRGEGNSGSGLGLGLSIASGYVRLHGGTIEARSEGVGHGSEFIVTLPLVEDR